MVATLVPGRSANSLSSPAFAAFVEAVVAVTDVDRVLLLTTMPRGGLQVCRSSAGVEAAARRYGTEWHTQDYSAWRALVAGHDTAADPTIDAAFGSGLGTVLSVRVDSPVFGGYPGVVRLMRSNDAGGAIPSADVVRELFQKHLGPVRASEDRQFILCGDRAVLGDRSHLSAGFAAGVVTVATTAAARPGTSVDRNAVPDDDGVRVAVQVSKFDKYPALGDGPVIFVSVPPRVEDWAALRADAFSADAELSRLVGAVTFMVGEFRRSPTLGDVADAVHLSQFHFHRRFTDLIGLTPKHLLYDLQLNEARRMLADPQQPLASIARQCGFAHQSHFTSRFKQGTGLTPTRWRRREIERPAAH